jgi:hypothetical protein
MAALTILGKTATRHEATRVYYWEVERFPFRVSIDEGKSIEGEDPNPVEGRAIAWSVRVMGAGTDARGAPVEIVRTAEEPSITLEEAATKIDNMCRSLMDDMLYWIG